MLINTKTIEEANDALTSIVMMNPNLGEHGIVLDLRFPQWGTIVGNDNQLTYSLHCIKINDSITI